MYQTLSADMKTNTKNGMFSILYMLKEALPSFVLKFTLQQASDNEVIGC
jgi:hypothetical protein